MTPGVMGWLAEHGNPVWNEMYRTGAANIQALHNGLGRWPKPIEIEGLEYLSDIEINDSLDGI